MSVEYIINMENMQQFSYFNLLFKNIKNVINWMEWQETFLIRLVSMWINIGKI